MRTVVPLAATSLQQQVQNASRYERKDGVVVNDAPNFRGMLAGAGVASAVTGGAALALSKTNILAAAGMRVPVRTVGLIGLAAAGLGVAMLGASFLVKPNVDHYLEKPTSDRDQAFADAAKFDDDVAIHKRSDGKYGLLDAGKFDIDNRGPGSVDLGNKPIVFEGFTSQDNDQYVRGADGAWSNIGIAGGPSIHLNELTGTNSGDLAKLKGSQLGTDSKHNALLVGDHIGNANGYSSLKEAGQQLFEQYGKDVVVLKLRDAYHGFALSGPSMGDSVHARGTVVTPLESAHVLSGAAFHSPSAPGSDFNASALSGISLAGLSSSSAAGLSSHRISTTSSGNIVRLGALAGSTSGYASMSEAGQAAYDMGSGQRAMLKLGDRWFVYRPTGEISKMASLLGPRDRLAVQQGNKLYQPTDAAGNLGFAGRATPFDVSEPIGHSVHVGSSGDSKVTRYVTSFADRASAINYLRSRGTELAVVEGENSRGTYHVYEVDGGSGGSDWDQQLGSVEAVVSSHSDTDYERHRTHRSGDYVYYEERTGTRRWTTLHDSTGSDQTLRDTGWDWGPWHETSEYDPVPEPSDSSSGGSSGGSSDSGSSGGSSDSGSSDSGGSSGGSGSSSGGSSGDNSNGDF